MATEHVNIDDPYIHEPKDISTSNSRELYVANGSGSGAWQGSILNTHGEMVIEGSTTATVTASAADTTLSTDSDYTKIVADWSAGHLEGITLNTDELVVPVDGDYYVSFWADIKVPKNNNFIGIKYSVNDSTPYSVRKLIGQSTTTNDYINLAGMGMIPGLPAGSTISMYIASTANDSLIVQEAGLICFILHEN